MIPQRRLSEHSIRISVYDSRRNRKHVPLGMVTHSLRAGVHLTNAVRDISRVDDELDSGCSAGSASTSCVRAAAAAAPAAGTAGGLLVGLTYNAGLRRLTVALLEAVQLESVSGSGGGAEHPSTYAKVTMYHHTRGIQSIRTETVRNSSCPKYAESFTLQLPADALSAIHLRIKVKQRRPPARRDVTLGVLTLGSHMFARGQMQEHWERMLHSPKEQIQMWHVLKVA
ncbi:synaptotagmin-15-like [Amphibalanus amphitrite]|uniref:synaptotagmin-15-like n=1 Tax=Amphibalanus amphitrite TaxID=1232801 RepID=UPI001C8FE694|nr:synaptotagmin-15-like [Amphibalanus amphitrite]